MTGLSQSRIAAFEQCPKRLWLMVYAPDCADPREPDGGWAAGHTVREMARTQYPGGVLVEAKPNLRAALQTTHDLLASGWSEPIFEATLEHEGVLVRIDILEPMPHGRARLIEVKSAGSAKPYHRGDLASQVWVAQGAGLDLTEVIIRHVDTRFVLQDVGNYAGVFQDVDLLADLEPLIAERPNIAASARVVLEGDEPDHRPGDHCYKPFPCPFISYCHSNMAPGPQWPVTVLPGGGGQHWLRQGITDLFALNTEQLARPIHKRVYEATTSDRPYHDVDGARAVIDCWSYPRTWLDFETIGFVLPRWVGMRPYTQAPFQFSAHIEDADGRVDHREFLDLSGQDPRRACAEALLSVLPAQGAIIAYNAPFEIGCIRDLALYLPDLAQELNAMADRIVDLLPVTRNHWYHRDQRGSWSIKAVLPTVAPELDYDGLAVKNGLEAQQAYLEAVDPACDPMRKDEIDQGMRVYCRRDTEAMIVLARHLCGAPRYLQRSALLKPALKLASLREAGSNSWLGIGAGNNPPSHDMKADQA